MSELGNKLAAFTEFHRGLRVGAGGTPLAEFLAREEARGPFARLWALEGYGYGRVERALRRTEVVPWSGDAEDVPANVLIPLHSGSGLALASRLVRDPGLAVGCQRASASALARFRDQCRQVSAAGWSGVAFEGLGLAVRNMRPELSRCLDFQLAGEPGLRALFWHGFGRALYFAPSHSWPVASWSAWQEATGSGGGALARSNRIAGLGWALALVNVRQPSLVRSRWRGAVDVSNEGSGDGATDALRHGMAAALRLWFERYGHDEVLARFRRFETDTTPPLPWAETMERFLADDRPLDGAGVEELFRCPAAGDGAAETSLGVGVQLDGLIGRGFEAMAAAVRGEFDPREPLVWSLDAMALPTLGLSELWASPLRRSLTGSSCRRGDA